MIVSIAMALTGLLLLYFGGDFLVRGSSGLALRFGLSHLAVGLTVVSFGTSIPELLVSVDAALSGANDISVGNVVGSNIANIALILGIAALIRPMFVESKVLGVDLPIMLLASLLLIIVLFGGIVSRLEGALLASALFLYVWMTLRRAKESDEDAPLIQGDERLTSSRPGKLVLLIISGLVLLFGGAHLLVVSAVELATMLHISQAAIGLTVVAVGTSLPELATTIVASLKGQGDIALGNVVGSNSFNIFGVLGLTAILHPLESGEISWLDLGLMAGLAFFIGALLLHRLFLNRFHGAILVTTFIIYTAWRLTA
jgi:cation:H+ antiporter